MSPMRTSLALKINCDWIGTRDANYSPPTWPLPEDYPVVIDANKKVVSRFGDYSWNLSPWAGEALNMNFGDGPTKGERIDRVNADLLRSIAAWWLWGPNPVQKPTTLVSRLGAIKPIFVACTQAGILATELSRYPKIIETAAAKLGPSTALEVLSRFHNLWLERTELGFVVFDETSLRQLSTLLVDRNSTQTAYIPPRIWAYQVRRLRECLEEYVAHKSQIESCYRFCLEAYETNDAGSFAKTSNVSTLNDRAPFNSGNTKRLVRARRFYGKFRLTATKYSIDELLDRWIGTIDQIGLKSLGGYLSLVNQVALAYLLNFSLMRVHEGASLRSNCYEVERDQLGDDIHLLRGATTKTIEDNDACWIVSPSVDIAIKAMKSIAQLRVEAAQRNPATKIPDEDAANPTLQIWAYEPWGASPKKRYARKRFDDYKTLTKRWPRLFDANELRITEDDYTIATRMTAGLDAEKFAVGKEWPLAWHQLRRTGAVNMLASGLVSDSSLQYQLKHAKRAMSRYYGQNYYHLNSNLNENAQGLYLREMYQNVVRECRNLDSPRFISPHGDKRKAQILNPISERTHEELLAAAEQGKISYKQTLLGGCTKLGKICPLGGISNISGCMGYGSEGPCENTLLDRQKRSVILAYRDEVASKLKAAPTGSALRDSLLAQMESAERAISVIDSSEETINESC